MALRRGCAHSAAAPLSCGPLPTPRSREGQDCPLGSQTDCSPGPPVGRWRSYIRRVCRREDFWFGHVTRMRACGVRARSHIWSPLAGVMGSELPLSGRDPPGQSVGVRGGRSRPGQIPSIPGSGVYCSALGGGLPFREPHKESNGRHARQGQAFPARWAGRERRRAGSPRRRRDVCAATGCGEGASGRGERHRVVCRARGIWQPGSRSVRGRAAQRARKRQPLSGDSGGWFEPEGVEGAGCEDAAAGPTGRSVPAGFLA